MPFAVRAGHAQSLRVAEVPLIVTSAVAEVDAADERDILDPSVSVADDDELLVVRSRPSYTLVQQHFAPGLVDNVAQVSILPGIEPKGVRMRPPEQAFDDHPAASSRCEHLPDLRVGVIPQMLVGVSAPVGEIEGVARTKLLDDLQQTREIDSPVDQALDPVTFCPCLAVRATAIDLGDVIAALAGRQEPVFELVVLRVGRWHSATK